MVSTASGCGNCFFKRREFVGTRGNPRAPIVFVGESPGAVEFSKGLPFVGPSGKVLEDCFPDSLTPNDYYVTNALQCMPKRSEDANKNQADLQAACRRCRDRLLSEIRAYPRKVIVALGNGALWALTGRFDLKITKERGKLLHSDLAERGIIATVHPAFLLRGGGSYRKFKMDIEYALDLASGGEEKKPIVPGWLVAETESDVKDFIDETLALAQRGGADAGAGDNVIAADIETDGFDHRQNAILALGWCIDPAKVFIVPESLLKRVPTALMHRDFDKAALYGGPLKWVWHNGKFDVKFLRTYGLRSAVDHDTMLMSYTMEEQRGFHDLEQVAADEIGAPDYKHMLKKYLPNRGVSFRAVPPKVLHHYLALDVSNVKQIYSRLYHRLLKDEKNTKLYHRVLLPASELLADVEANGMLVDFGKVKENTEYYLDIMRQEEAKINAISRACGGGDINPNSPAQLNVLIYDMLRLSNRRRGTGADILDKLPAHPLVDALKTYRKAAKAYGTYVKPLAEQVSDDGRVHATYLIHGTATGRLSSRNPNMQNQPRGPRLRGQFIPAEGHIYCEMDLDQAELRCLAALSRDDALCAIYEQGRKIHKEVSIDLWGADWERRYALDEPGNPEYDQAKEEYMRTKALNFGIIYGREAPSIAAEFEISQAEAQKMVDGWAKKFPDAWAYIQKCRMAPVKGQNLVTPFGRRKRAGVISRERLKDLQNEAANFPHQSIASDITLLSAVKVREKLSRWGVKIVNLIHDAILIELPDNMDLCKEVAAYVTGEMMKTPIEWGIDRIPFKADAKIGYNWGQLHDLEL